MKKKLLFSVVSLAMVFSSVQSSYLKIENVEEAKKVATSIASFWDYHSEVRHKILSASTPQDVDFEILKESDHYLAHYIRTTGKKRIIQDITDSLQCEAVSSNSNLCNELKLLNYIVSLY